MIKQQRKRNISNIRSILIIAFGERCSCNLMQFDEKRNIQPLVIAPYIEFIAKCV
jgi:hypothetical protein